MADIQSNININVDTSSALASIKLLQSQISAFHTSMAKGTAENVTASRQLQQRLIDSVNATQKFSAGIQTIKTTTESFTTALEKNKLSLGQYFRYSIAATKSFGGVFKTEMATIDKVARERVKDLQTQYIQLGRDASGAMKAIAVRPLTLDLENLQTKTALAAQKQQILNQLLKQGSTNLLNFGKNTQWAGRQLMVGFTIPLSMAATAASKAYMEIEKASVQIRRVYGDLNTTAAETNNMVNQIKMLAGEYTKYGIAISDTMAMAAKAAAMGKTGADLLAQVNQASKLSALGGVDQNSALETTISLTNAFALKAEELGQKINFLNAVENQTVLSIEDMTIAIPKAAPVVQQLGGSVEDLAYFLTAMKEGGINASEGANALKSGLSSLINPSKKASEFLMGFGVNVKGIVEQDKGNLKKTVTDFAFALDKIDPLNRARAIEMMFGKFQFSRISTLLQNVTKEGSQASKALELANMSSIQLAAISRKELDKMQSSPMYKFQKAIADLQLKIAPIGETFLKAVTPIIEKVSSFLDGFNQMGDGFKQFVVTGVALLGGLAPVLLMVIGLVANGAANIIKMFANVKAFLNKTTTESQVLGETTNYLTTEQIKAEAVAASLDQTHTKLKQTFTSETSAVIALMEAYQGANVAMSRFKVPAMPTSIGKGRKLASGGIISGPGTGTSDSIPAMVSNGEAIIPAKNVARFPGLVRGLVSGSIPGFKQGRTGFEASHGSGMTAEELPSLIGEMAALDQEFADLEVTLFEVKRAADGVIESTREQVKMSELAGKRTVFAGGAAYGGTALAESGTRNQAYNILGIKGFASTLDEVVSQGELAAQALKDHTNGIKTINEDYLPEVEKMALEGRRAARLLKDSNTADEERIKYSRNIAKQMIAQGLVAQNKMSAEQALIEAERVLAIEDQKLVGVTKNKVRVAQLRYGMASIRTGGTGEFASTEDLDPSVQFATRDVGRGLAEVATQSDANSGKRRQRVRPLFEKISRAFAYRGKYSKDVAPKFTAAGLDFPATAFNAGLQKEFNDEAQATAKTASESKRTRKTAKDTVDGYANELERGKKKTTAVAKRATQSETDLQLKQLEVRRKQAEMIGADTAVIEKEIIARKKQIDAAKQAVIAEQKLATQRNLSNLGPIGPMLPDGRFTKNVNQGRVAGSIERGLYKGAGALSRLGTGKTAGLGMAVSMGAYAIAGTGGPVGEAVNSLLPLINTVSLLTPIFSSLLPKIMQFIPMIARFAGPVGLAITAITLLGQAAIFAANESTKEARAKLAAAQKTEQANKAGQSAMASLAELSGVSLKKDLSETAAAGVSSANFKQASDVSLLLSSTEFKDKTSNVGQLVQSIKKMSEAEATAFLSTYGNKLKSAGFSEDNINSLMRALEIAAGKKSLNLQFKDITYGSKAGINNLKTGVGSAASAYVGSTKAGNQAIVDAKQQASGMNFFGILGKDYEKGVVKNVLKTDTNYQTMTTNFTNLKTSVTSNLSSMIQQLKDGQISVGQYTTALNAMKTSLQGLSDVDMRKLVSQTFVDANGKSLITPATAALLNFNQQLALMQMYYANPESAAAVVAEINKGGNAAAVALAKLTGFTPEVARDTAKDYYGTTPSTTGTGGTSPGDVLKNAQDAAAASTRAGNMIKLGFGKSLIDTLSTADKKTRDYYSYIDKNGNIVLKKAGLDLQKAFDAKSIQDFKNAFAQKSADTSKQVTLQNALIKSGMSIADAQRVAADETSREYYFLQKTPAARAAALKLLREQVKLEEQVKTAQEKFQEAYDKAQKYFATKKAKIELEFDMNPTNKANQEAVLKANRAIEDLQMGVNGQAGLNDYNNGLSKIQFREDEINKKYDERQKALTKIQDINARINQQQQDQLSLASALSSGDISAAADAARQMQQNASQQAAADQQKALETAKEKELAAVTVMINGKKMTRLEIEKESKIIQEKILDIQTNQLIPAEKALTLATRLKDDKIKLVDAEQQIWEAMKNGIDDAEVSAKGFMSTVEAAMALAKEAIALFNSGGGSIPEPSGPSVPTATKVKVTATSSGGGGGAIVHKDGTSAGVGLVWKGGKAVVVPKPNLYVSGAQWTWDTASASWKQTKIPVTPTPGEISSYHSQKTLAAAQLRARNVANPTSGDWSNANAAYNNAQAAIRAFESKWGTGYASGGLVKPSFMNIGGLARGTDTVPAMLTPGEFVVRKFAVDNFGVDNLKAINNGSTPASAAPNVLSNTNYDGSVYNYSVNVNVRSDANPDQIAGAVMQKINQINSQRIRGNRI